MDAESAPSTWRGERKRYLDCGLFENGFARVRCPDCHAEYLLAFSCKTRDLCPSCAARRAAATAVLLADDVLEDVGHAQWVLTLWSQTWCCGSMLT